jgi:hypothetical protein
MVAAKLANMRQGNFSKAANLPVSPVSQSHAAEMLNVSERTVRSAREVLDEGAPELVEAVQHVGYANLQTPRRVALTSMRKFAHPHNRKRPIGRLNVGQRTGPKLSPPIGGLNR